MDQGYGMRTQWRMKSGNEGGENNHISLSDPRRPIKVKNDYTVVQLIKKYFYTGRWCFLSVSVFIPCPFHCLRGYEPVI